MLVWKDQASVGTCGNLDLVHLSPHHRPLPPSLSMQMLVWKDQASVGKCGNLDLVHLSPHHRPSLSFFGFQQHPVSKIAYMAQLCM